MDPQYVEKDNASPKRGAQSWRKWSRTIGGWRVSEDVGGASRMNQSKNELLHASGHGHEFFTERVVFYLTYRASIEQWAKLQYEAGPATSQFMESLQEEVSERCGDWNLWKGDLRKYRCLMVTPFAITAGSHPPVGIALGWHQALPATPEEETETCPFTGVYADPDSVLADAVLGRLETSELSDGGHPYRVSPRWPRFEYVMYHSNWWTDLDGYRTKLLTRLEEMLRRYREPLAAVALHVKARLADDDLG